MALSLARNLTVKGGEQDEEIATYRFDCAGSRTFNCWFYYPYICPQPDDGGATPASEEAWEVMHEACEDSDWEAMTEAAEEVHGDDFDYMPCHDENNYAPTNRWGGMGGHMGRGMMG